VGAVAAEGRVGEVGGGRSSLGPGERETAPGCEVQRAEGARPGETAAAEPDRRGAVGGPAGEVAMRRGERPRSLTNRKQVVTDGFRFVASRPMKGIEPAPAE